MLATLAYQSLFLNINATCLAEEHQLKILTSLVWPGRVLNPRRSALEAKTLPRDIKSCQKNRISYQKTKVQ